MKRCIYWAPYAEVRVPVSKVTYHHFCHIVFIRSGCHSVPVLKGKRSYKSVDSLEMGIIRPFERLPIMAYNASNTEHIISKCQLKSKTLYKLVNLPLVFSSSSGFLQFCFNM